MTINDVYSTLQAQQGLGDDATLEGLTHALGKVEVFCAVREDLYYIPSSTSVSTPYSLKLAHELAISGLSAILHSTMVSRVNALAEIFAALINEED